MSLAISIRFLTVKASATLTVCFLGISSQNDAITSPSRSRITPPKPHPFELKIAASVFNLNDPWRISSARRGGPLDCYWSAGHCLYQIHWLRTEFCPSRWSLPCIFSQKSTNCDVPNTSML